MKLMTKALEKNIPSLAECDVENPTIVAHYFNPCGAGDWYVLGGEKLKNGDWRFFGYVKLLENELGYFLLSQLESVELPFGLKIERDLYWTPKQLSEVKEC